MAICEVCGNDYDRTLSVSVAGGETHTFDSFECAIALLAPTCAHCSCRIIGHGIQAGDTMFCCAHCARQEGHPAAADRV
jgi:hypothetical protein